MIHYVAMTASGGLIKYAFRGSVGVSQDVERVLGLGSRMTRGVPCVGHDVHEGGGPACRCVQNGQIVWTEKERA